jgi:type I restriction enzyme, S subunit
VKPELNLKPLGSVLEQRREECRIDDPKQEQFVTVKLYGKGAIPRKIGDGKTPCMKIGIRLKAGDLVYSRIDARNGAFALVPKELNGAVVSKDFPTFKIAKGRIHPSYLTAYLGSETFFGQLQASSYGTTNRQRISEAMFLSYRIPLPPLIEQERIVSLLDAADELRRLRAQANRRTADLVPAIFEEMFGDPASNPKGWPESRFAEQLRLLEYGPRFCNEEYSQSGTKIARITDLDQTGKLDFDSMPRMVVTREIREARCLKPGDIIMARSGATVGKSALIGAKDPECIAGAYFIRLHFSEHLHPVYVKAVLDSRSLQAAIARQSVQSAQQNFNGPLIRALPLPVPPLHLQQEFATRLQEIEQLRVKQGESRCRLDDLFQSMLHRAFRGEL